MVSTSFLNKLHTAAKGCRCSVFVYAFLDVNVGDDLFVRKLISSYPDVHFVMIARKPYGQMFGGYPNVTVFEEEGFLLNACRKLGIADRIRWRIAHECDYAVYIGGSIFIEYSSWENQHLWYRDLFDNDRLYFIGCNWGPCRTERFEQDMKDVFSRMRDVCFRDRYSWRTFSALPNVRYAPDILFGMDWSAYAGIAEQKQVLISVVDCCAEPVGLAAYKSGYNRFIADLTERFAGMGYHTVLCAFWENCGDLAAAEEIRESLPPQVKESTSVVCYCGTNLDQILELVAESEYVVATRFHAMILGLSAGKKVLPLIYNLKTRTVLEDLSYQGIYYEISGLPADCADVIPAITRGISDGDRQRLARLSAGHFDRLNEALNVLEEL